MHENGETLANPEQRVGAHDVLGRGLAVWGESQIPEGEKHVNVSLLHEGSKRQFEAFFELPADDTILHVCNADGMGIKLELRSKTRGLKDPFSVTATKYAFVGERIGTDTNLITKTYGVNDSFETTPVAYKDKTWRRTFVLAGIFISDQLYEVEREASDGKE